MTDAVRALRPLGLATLLFLAAGATGHAQQSAENVARAKAALDSGRTFWLRYDTEANRRTHAPDCYLAPSIDSASIILPPDPPPDMIPIILPAEQAALRLHSEFNNCTAPVAHVGEADYQDAERLFRRATTLNPLEPRAFRDLAMLLAEKNRWKELELVARDRVASTPGDAWAQLSLGLALQRTRRVVDARTAFEAGAAELSLAERSRLFSFARLLERHDSASYVKSSPEARTAREQTYWTMATPLWSRPGDDPRTEFLARVTYAELRWTVDESRVRGADSDRGEAYIRFGPPDVIGVVRSNDFQNGAGVDVQQLGQHRLRQSQRLAPQSDLVTYWDYATGLTLVFWGAPTYGTAHFPIDDGAHITRLTELRPSSFDNVATATVADVTLQTARFRAPGDSVDIVIASLAPVRAIQRTAGANAPIREYAWLLPAAGGAAQQDSLTVAASGIHVWNFRVAPAAYVYRIEASTAGADVVGRAVQRIQTGRDTATMFAPRGFGMSDVFVATRAEPKRATGLLRWRDFDVAPVLGAMTRQGTLDIVWENYEFGDRNGQAQYHVAITVQRERSAAGRIAAQIVSAVTGAVGVSRRDDRVILSFDRTGPASPAFADYLTIALGDTPPGRYRLTIEVTDRTSGHKTSRSTELAIAE